MAFHLYDINELYSNADGTIQFIELIVGSSDGENLWMNHTITVTQGMTTHSYTVPSNLSSDQTANTTVLIATQGFADLGIVTPDFIVPSGFLFSDGGTVNYAEDTDTLIYSSLPTDGTLSLNRNLTTGTNSPKNFAGDTGTAIVGSAAPDNLTGTAAGDLIFGFGGDDTVFGGEGNDSILGGDGNDILQGNAGNDTVKGALGDDDARGGQGDDKVSAGQGNDVVRGALGNDELRGGLNNDTLYGGQGSDTLFGGQNEDQLRGLAGNDLMTAGLGADQFWFNAFGTANADTIADFVAGEDQVVLEAALFTSLAGTPGSALDAANFASGAGVTAQSATQFVLYDTANGNLYYDADGSGAGAAELVATLTGTPAVSASDILIV